MEFWENFKGYIGQFCNILTKIVYSNNIYIMGINCLLISISGSPKILSDFIPDNGLGILASCLVKEGNNVKILDFNRIEIFRKVIPPEIKRQYPKTPWREVSGMRDILIHEYFGVDLELTWGVVVDDLPRLKANITEVKNKIKK